MIVDAHTHVFPASQIERRASLVREDSEFAALYRDPRARLTTAPELLAAMDRDGVAVALICGITWGSPAAVAEQNDSLLAAASNSGGRLAAVCAVPITHAAAVVAEMDRCARRGAAGFGELRLDAYNTAEPDLPLAVAKTAVRLDLPLLLHASEPVGHAYAGKSGGDLGTIWRMLSACPDLRVVLAHLGGGLPFFAHMPEVRERLRSVYVDTAAAAWLYDAAAVRSIADQIGADRILFGSDYPLRRASRDLEWLRSSGLSDADLDLICGRNALRAYGLEARTPAGGAVRSEG